MRPADRLISEEAFELAQKFAQRALSLVAKGSTWTKRWRLRCLEMWRQRCRTMTRL
jgi:hypothetical protein